MVGWHHRLDGPASSGSWGWTGRPGVLPSMGSQRISDMTERLNRTELKTETRASQVAQR